ncbi:MAG: LPS biosynthesis protein WbpP [Marinilabiliales bacterium]|nr:MAG: LPS biosynthesis protein WbpP [Marinilabiliales bacterium]
MTEQIKGKKFIVTGGAGFIGSHLSEHLLENGASKVIVIDNLLTGFVKNIEHLSSYPAFEFAETDINDRNTIASYFEGADVVFHEAALGSVPRSVKNPVDTNLHNGHGFVNIAFLAKEAGVKKLVFASSSSVYGDDTHQPKIEIHTGKALSPYAISKKTNEMYAELFAELYEMDITGLRYFNVFGPRQNPEGPYAAVIPIFIDKILKGENVPIYGTGEQSRDFTYVKNVVNANILAAFTPNTEKPYRIINIANGGLTSVNELFENLKKHIGGISEALYLDARKGDIFTSTANIDKAKNILNYQAEYSLQEGLEETVAWYKNQL